MREPAMLPEVADLRRHAIEPLKERFPGREEIVELIGLALAAGEHLLIVGPPGTAKSAVVGEFAARLRGRYFEYLLTRFTEPSEVFGPVDIPELRAGRVVVRTEGMLPDAEIAFLDEVFNAGSAILNSLLGIINDRAYRRGAEVHKSELISVFAATNRIPDDPALRALDDRFTMRVECTYLAENRMVDLLGAGWRIESEELRGVRRSETPRVTTDSIRRVHAAVASVDTEAIRGPLGEVVHRVRHGGMRISDRRAVKLQRLCAASAVLCGRGQVVVEDLWPARYLWETEDDREAVGEVVETFLEERTAGDAGGVEEVHPLALPAARPSELLERLSKIEEELRRLEDPSAGREPAVLAADSLHNELCEIATDRRWCRARTPADEAVLRKVGERLDVLSDAIARLENPP